MLTWMTHVKTRGPQARRERAMATKARILDCAYEQFCEHGYLPTTMAAIAAAAGIATQTVYYVFRTKAQLLREVTEAAAAGLPNPAPVMERQWMREALTSADPRKAIELIVDNGVEIYARVAPLLPTLHTATSVDEELDAYWRSVTEGRRKGMERFVATLYDKGFLRPELDVRHAADILFVLDSHETFLGLTRGAGWSLDEFKPWLHETLCWQLLESPAR
jgi:AcrR family transcriptional regulator